jgi:GT2 family glycosyltransferase
MNKIQVSVVIVCMNNLKNLYPCLDSIKNHTTVSYETLVVAYLFSEENLQKLKTDYPWIIIIESNEIRGFSENNNLALKQAKGEYCFVLNDDTKFYTPVVDLLVKSIEQVPDAAIMSPKTLFADGRLQSCGRPKMNAATCILSKLKLWNEQKVKLQYTNKKGIFQSYNVVGAAFLIKTDVFKELGFFDETYFFCPEDIALSTLANKRGYKCYVDESVSLYHLEGGSASKVRLATAPAATKGAIIFYSDNSLIKKITLEFIIVLISTIKMAYWGIKSICKKKPYNKIQMLSYRNVIQSVFLNKTPKEIFIFYYNQL